MVAIPAKITNFFKNPKTSKYIAKGIGIATLGLIAYDSHYLGKIKADTYSSERDADASLYYLNNTLYSNNMSKVEEGIKEGALNLELHQGVRRFFNEGIGYIKGFTSMLISNVVELGLGIGALLGSKFSAIGLCAIGAYKLIKNAFGLGVPNGLGK